MGGDETEPAGRGAGDAGCPGLAEAFQGRQHRPHARRSHDRAGREARRRPPPRMPRDGVAGRAPVHAATALSANRRGRPQGAGLAVLTEDAAATRTLDTLMGLGAKRVPLP